MLSGEYTELAEKDGEGKAVPISFDSFNIFRSFVMPLGSHIYSLINHAKNPSQSYLILLTLRQCSKLGWMVNTAWLLLI